MKSPNQQLQRTVIRRRVRAARPLNCGVMRHDQRSASFGVSTFGSFRCWLSGAWQVSLFIFVVEGTSACSADLESEPIAETTCIYPPLNISDMERELTSRGVAFSREGDCLTFKASYGVSKAAQLAAFGEPPPSGRATRPDDPSAMVQQLARAGIDARIMTYGGMDYVVWSAEDAERAEVLLGMSAERREVLKRMRESAPSSR